MLEIGKIAEKMEQFANKMNPEGTNHEAKTRNSNCPVTNLN
jgi:hypothetical protein